MKKLWLLILPAIFLFSACSSSSKLTSSWASKENTGFKNILVLGLLSDKNRSTRVRMEQHLVTDLKKFNYNAIAASDQYDPKYFKGLSEDQALDKLKNSGIDAVITITLLVKSQQKSYVPGNYSYAPYPMYPRFWGYYSFYYPRIYQPGYYRNNTKYYFETNLYNINNNDLVYSAQSETFNPTSASSLADDYAKTIIRDMRRKDVLK